MLHTAQSTEGQEAAHCGNAFKFPGGINPARLSWMRTIVVSQWGQNSAAAICNLTGFKDLGPKKWDEVRRAYGLPLIRESMGSGDEWIRWCVCEHAWECLNESQLRCVLMSCEEINGRCRWNEGQTDGNVETLHKKWKQTAA